MHPINNALASTKLAATNAASAIDNTTRALTKAHQLINTAQTAAHKAYLTALETRHLATDPNTPPHMSLYADEAYQYSKRVFKKLCNTKHAINVVLSNAHIAHTTAERAALSASKNITPS